MPERLSPTRFNVLRQADALAAWVLLGWLGQRLGWSFASGVLPVVVWWTLRCGGAAFAAPGPSPSVWPLAGAGLLLATLPVLPPGGAALLVLLAAAALWGGWSASLASASGDNTATLPGQAMGLMMGGLWLSGQWCLGPGWTDLQAVTLHLGLMVGGPLLLSALWRPSQRAPRVSGWPPAALLAAGALLMAWADAGAWRLAGMVLLVLAWSLGTHGAPLAKTRRRPVPLGFGPVLLLAVGLLAPTQGPLAMQSAWGVVAVLALAGLAPWRPHRPAPTLEPQRWSDVS